MVTIVSGGHATLLFFCVWVAFSSPAPMHKNKQTKNVRLESTRDLPINTLPHTHAHMPTSGLFSLRDIKDTHTMDAAPSTLHKLELIVMHKILLLLLIKSTMFICLSNYKPRFMDVQK